MIYLIFLPNIQIKNEDILSCDYSKYLPTIDTVFHFAGEFGRWNGEGYYEKGQLVGPQKSWHFTGNLKEEADDKQVEFMGNGRNLDIRLTKGRHSLRVEYLDYGGEARLSLSIMTPNRNKVSLVKENKSSIWQNAPGGHPITSRAQAKIFRPLQLLDRFAVELEFISTGQPRFVFALGSTRTIGLPFITCFISLPEIVSEPVLYTK